MVLEWIDYKLDGNKWESLCLDICRIVYKDDFFHEVPSNYKGDGGIEGFTKSDLGIVIQCYCPNDSNLSYDKLYESQRDKVTEDIEKIIKNHKLLKQIGVKKIEKWIFMVPEYKDRRLLKHCNDKQEYILKEKSKGSKYLDYISDNFEIHIKVANDYKAEIARLIRTGKTDIYIEIPEQNEQPINWSNMPSDKSKNISRKMTAVISEKQSNTSRINKLIDLQVKRYIYGKIALEKLSNEYPDIWSEVMKLEMAFKEKVEEKTLLSPNNEMHWKVYNDLTSEFEKTLQEELTYLKKEMAITLSQYIVSTWLADCHMEFY